MYEVYDVQGEVLCTYLIYLYEVHDQCCALTAVYLYKVHDQCCTLTQSICIKFMISAVHLLSLL